MLAMALKVLSELSGLDVFAVMMTEDEGFMVVVNIINEWEDEEVLVRCGKLLRIMMRCDKALDVMATSGEHVIGIILYVIEKYYMTEVILEEFVAALRN